MSRILSRIFFAISVMIVVYLTLNLVIRPKKDYVLRFRPSDVTSLRIVNPQKSSVNFRFVSGANGGYWLVGDGKHPDRLADTHTVDVLLAILARIEFVEKFEETESDLKLGDTLTATITLNSGKTLSLNMGREAPSGTEYYVSNSSDPGVVYLVSNRFYPLLSQDVVNFWRRQILEIPAEASQVVIKAFGETLSLDRTKTGWHYSSNPVNQIEGSSAQDLIRSLEHLSFIRFFGSIEDKSDLEQYGLLVPNFEITVVRPKASKITSYISLYRDRYYMLADDTNVVFILAPETVQPIVNILQKVIM